MNFWTNMSSCIAGIIIAEPVQRNDISNFEQCSWKDDQLAQDKGSIYGPAGDVGQAQGEIRLRQLHLWFTIKLIDRYILIFLFWNFYFYLHILCLGIQNT